jgi:aryl-alcohol dehydrogenase-like predicted oxidoreductase
MTNGNCTRRLGNTGTDLFPVGLGAMQLSMNDPPDEDLAIAVIGAALDAGANFIDTANVYFSKPGDVGHNERLVAKALRRLGMGASVVVATKGGVDGHRRRVDGSPAFLRASCVESLRALGCEAIHLYQLHAPDDQVPIEESVGELARLQEEGKILHIGVSNVSSGELVRALATTRIESVQNRCNPFEADDYFSGLVHFCDAHQLTYFPHGVMGGKPAHRELAQDGILNELARRHETTPFALVLAWHLSKSERVIPIPGASRPELSRANTSGASLKLPSEDLARIDAICAFG